MNNYRMSEEKNGYRNGSVTYVIGDSRGREGFDVTKYWSAGSSRKNFPDDIRLEAFLDEESSNSRITIKPVRRASRRTMALIEKLSSKYSLSSAAC